MRIYKISYKRNKNFLDNFKNIKTKKIFLILFFTIFFLGGALFTPIGLFRLNSKYARLLGQSIYSIAGKFGPQYSYLAKDVFLLGDNIFGLGSRYLISFFKKRDRLNINLNSKNYQRILNLRNEAMKESILIRTQKDKVKGSISYKGKEYPIRIRLKGDWTDHLLGEKWSFRVETKGDNAFLGMREFSLQHPRTRSYISEFILHKLLKSELKIADD